MVAVIQYPPVNNDPFPDQVRFREIAAEIRALLFFGNHETAPLNKRFIILKESPNYCKSLHDG